MKFGNTANKIKAILGVIKENELIKGSDIAHRLSEKGYTVEDGNINMFIYHNMLYKHLTRERIKGINYYAPLM